MILADPAETPFLRAIHDRPDDDLPRLIFADWLDERGDPRGELLRIFTGPTPPGDARAVERIRRKKLGVWLAQYRWPGIKRHDSGYEVVRGLLQISAPLESVTHDRLGEVIGRALNCGWAKSLHIYTDEYPPSPETGETIRKRLAETPALSFGSTVAVDAPIVALEGLPRLQSLDLTHTSVTDAALTVLPSLAGLRHLTLHHCMMLTPAVIASVRRCRRLESFSVGDLSLSDADFASLEQMPALRSLDVRATDISDRALDSFSRCAHLSSLSFDTCKGITDNRLERLHGISKLRKLTISDCPVHDEGLAIVATMTNLERLVLFDLHVTDVGLRHLEQLKNLRSCFLRGLDATGAAYIRLRRALPECKFD